MDDGVRCPVLLMLLRDHALRLCCCSPCVGRDLSRLEPAASPSTSSSEDRVLPAIDNSIGEAWLEHLNVLAVRAASFCSDSS